MGGIVQDVLGTVGIGQTQAGESREAAMALQQQIIDRLDKIGIPPIEAQRIILEQPKLLELYIPELEGKTEQVRDTFLANVAVPEEFKSAQLEALRGIQSRTEQGFTPEEQAQINQVMRNARGEAQARDAAILQNLAQRGMGGSGAELIARLGANQQAQQAAALQSEQLAAQASANKMAALQNLGQMATGLRGQEVQEQSDVARARDAIEQFNTQQRQAQKLRDLERINQSRAQNVAAKQQYADQAANIRNQQEMYNKGLIQQQYQNQLQKAGAISGAQQNLAGSLMQTGAAQQEGFQNLLGGAAKLGAAAISSGCFVAGSMVHLADNSYRPIEKLKLGDELAHGGKITGIEVVRPDSYNIYNYMGILVTGDQRVYEDGRLVQVRDSQNALQANVNADKVYNLKTEKGMFMVQNIMFADMQTMKDEDKRESILKMIEQLQVLYGRP